MNAHELMNYELAFDLNNLRTYEGGNSRFDERDDAIGNEPIEEVDNVQIGDVLVNKVGFKDAKSAVTLKHFWEQKSIDVTPLI